MRTALIITTINIPVVLSLYRKLDPDVGFFVACDKKTPDAIGDFLTSIGAHFVWEGSPKFACSDLISWGTISRRNIALLEALKWGAELIVSVDDDNICIDEAYFSSFRIPIREVFNGIKAKAKWFDPASLCFPTDGKPVVQRGFPQQLVLTRGHPHYEPITDAKIGVAQGMILGDPDTSAIDRISQHPKVHQVSELLRAGIVTDPRETYTPLNSQNIAFVRELAPCFLMVPSFGRYDDIYASLIAQRVMRERGYHVHYGQPFVWQQRNPHNLLKDLAQEQWGAEHILDFTAWLDGFNLTNVPSVVGMMRVLFTNLPPWMPAGTQELGLAWCDDVERVL